MADQWEPPCFWALGAPWHPSDLVVARFPDILAELLPCPLLLLSICLQVSPESTSSVHVTCPRIPILEAVLRDLI